MATHTSILAWEIPCTEDSGGPQSMGSQMSWMGLNNNSELIPDSVLSISACASQTQLRTESPER